MKIWLIRLISRNLHIFHVFPKLHQKSEQNSVTYHLFLNALATAGTISFILIFLGAEKNQFSKCSKSTPSLQSSPCSLSMYSAVAFLSCAACSSKSRAIASSVFTPRPFRYMQARWIMASEFSLLLAYTKYSQAFLQERSTMLGMPLRQTVPKLTIASELPISAAQRQHPTANCLSCLIPYPLKQQSPILFFAAACSHQEASMKQEMAFFGDFSTPKPCSWKIPKQKSASPLSLLMISEGMVERDSSSMANFLTTLQSQCMARWQWSSYYSFMMEVWFMSSQANWILHLQSPFMLPSQNSFSACYELRWPSRPLEQMRPRLQYACEKPYYWDSVRRVMMFLSISLCTDAPQDFPYFSASFALRSKTAKLLLALERFIFFAFSQQVLAFFSSFFIVNNFLVSAWKLPNSCISPNSAIAYADSAEIWFSISQPFSISALFCPSRENFPLMRQSARRQLAQGYLPLMPFWQQVIDLLRSTGRKAPSSQTLPKKAQACGLPESASSWQMFKPSIMFYSRLIPKRYWLASWRRLGLVPVFRTTSLMTSLMTGFQTYITLFQGHFFFKIQAMN